MALFRGLKKDAISSSEAWTTREESGTGRESGGRARDGRKPIPLRRTENASLGSEAGCRKKLELRFVNSQRRSFAQVRRCFRVRTRIRCRPQRLGLRGFEKTRSRLRSLRPTSRRRLRSTTPTPRQRSPPPPPPSAPSTRSEARPTTTIAFPSSPTPTTLPAPAPASRSPSTNQPVQRPPLSY